MRPDAPGPGYIAAGLALSSSVDIWYGGQVVALGVPVAAGRYLAERDQPVPERLNATLPLEWQGTVLSPGRKGSVLSSDGHELATTVHLRTPDGTRRWDVPIGRMRVQSWKHEAAGVAVRCEGLLRKVQGHRRAAPRSPARASLIAGELANELGQVGLLSRKHPALADRPVPRDFVIGQDRFKAVQELIAAWPARMRVDSHGIVEFLPPLSPDIASPDVTFTDGEGGTLVGAPSEGTREGVFNHVIVHVAPTDDAPAITYQDWLKTGRLAVATYGWESQEVESPAITSVAQAQSIVWQKLTESQLRAWTLPVEAAVDWRVELDDTAAVTRHEGVDVVGRFTGLDLPLTSADGVARYNVGVVD